MNVSDLEHFRNLLTARERGLSEWQGGGSGGNEQDAGRVRELLTQIKDALEHIEDKTYGRCTCCDGEVEHQRLEAQPVAQVCLECLSKQERDVLQEELFLASKMHRALLPQRVEQIDGFEVAVKSLAAHIVGGDYYDFLPSPDGGRMRVIIADSMGKGLPAGLLMSNFQGALRVLANEIESPASLVGRLNHWLCRNIAVTKFITLACLALESSSDGNTRLTLANAGHCPPILVRKNGTIELLAATGSVVGVHEDFAYEERDLELSSGDLILLYTDGVTEAENSDGEMFGEERLIEFVRNRRSENSETLLENLSREVQLFSGKSEPGDDLTVLALRKK